MRVVLDSNIFVSAFRFDKELLELVDKCVIDEEITIISSLVCYGELLEVLAKKFHQTEEQLWEVEEVFKEVTMVSPRITLHVVRDPKDDKFVEAAVEGRANYIVSGDKALLELGLYRGIKIIKPAEFMKIIAEL